MDSHFSYFCQRWLFFLHLGRKGVFGSPGELSHPSHAKSSYDAYIQLSFIVVCLVARVS
jgi:hypothetical protein